MNAVREKFDITLRSKRFIAFFEEEDSEPVMEAINLLEEFIEEQLEVESEYYIHSAAEAYNLYDKLCYWGTITPENKDCLIYCFRLVKTEYMGMTQTYR